MSRDDVVDVDCDGVDHGATAWNITLNPDPVDPGWSVNGDGFEKVSVNPADGRVGCATEPCSACRHRIHHGLDVGRRAGDDAQDLRGRSLLLLRFRELAVPRL